MHHSHFEVEKIFSIIRLAYVFFLLSSQSGMHSFPRKILVNIQHRNGDRGKNRLGREWLLCWNLEAIGDVKTFFSLSFFWTAFVL